MVTSRVCRALHAQQIVVLYTHIIDPRTPGESMNVLVLSSRHNSTEREDERAEKVATRDRHALIPH